MAGHDIGADVLELAFGLGPALVDEAHDAVGFPVCRITEKLLRAPASLGGLDTQEHELAAHVRLHRFPLRRVGQVCEVDTQAFDVAAHLGLPFGDWLRQNTSTPTGIRVNRRRAGS